MVGFQGGCRKCILTAVLVTKEYHNKQIIIPYININQKDP
jgi:hypothetical protein